MPRVTPKQRSLSVSSSAPADLVPADLADVVSMSEVSRAAVVCAAKIPRRTDFSTARAVRHLTLASELPDVSRHAVTSKSVGNVRMHPEKMRGVAGRVLPACYAAPDGAGVQPEHPIRLCDQSVRQHFEAQLHATVAGLSVSGPDRRAEAEAVPDHSAAHGSLLHVTLVPGAHLFACTF